MLENESLGKWNTDCGKVQKNKGKFMLMGNVPDRKEFHVNFPNIEAARAAKEAAMKIEGGPRSYSGFYQGGMTWEAEEII